MCNVIENLHWKKTLVVYVNREKNVIANGINTNWNAIFFLSRTSDDLNVDVESSRRIEYDGLRQVIFSVRLLLYTFWNEKMLFNNCTELAFGTQALFCWLSQNESVAAG